MLAGAAPEKSLSVKPMEMIDRPVAVADAEAVRGRDRGTDPGLGVADGGFQIVALGKPRRNRRRQRAAGAMGIFGRDPRRGERDRAFGVDEIIDALGALPVAALDKHRRAAHRQQALALVLDGGFAPPPPLPPPPPP